MKRATIAEARVFVSWQDYQDALKRAVSPLTEEQLQKRLLPGLRTPGEIAEHIVFGRALHLYRTLGEAAWDLLSPRVDRFLSCGSMVTEMLVERKGIDPSRITEQAAAEYTTAAFSHDGKRLAVGMHPKPWQVTVLAR